MEANILQNEVYSKEQALEIAKEFRRTKGTCYLDHAGATLYSEQQLQLIFQELSKNVYGNPHTKSLHSHITVDSIDIVRFQVLTHFNTDPDNYSVVFTSGATEALKLIAETFEFQGGTLVYLEDNHTSVLGMRSYAPSYKEFKLDEANKILTKNKIERNEDKNKERKRENNLFVYPAESNFSGTKYPLAWISKIQNGIFAPTSAQNWFVVLDAATFVSTNFLDLTKYQPDFVTISFYKIFGYPTGLGALLVKKSIENVLKKKYFGGGTVLMALSSENIMIPRPDISERFEDGTNSYLSIISLRQGFETLNRLGLTMDLISKHTYLLANYTYKRLAQLHHSNGKPAVLFYHDTNFGSIESQGGIVTFNLKRENGDFVGFAEVLHLANLYNIHLRTGCFCNPGACQKHLNLSSEEVRKQFKAGHVCGDENDLINGHPTGAVRISFGYMSTYECADTFLNMIENCFVTKPIIRKNRDINTKSIKKIRQSEYKTEENNEIKDLEYKKVIEYDTEKTLRQDHMDMANDGKVVFGKLTKILLYPIKSCGAYCPQTPWPITSTGFQYDRKWMIVKSTGTCVSQKQIKELCLIEPFIDVHKNVLRMSYKGDPDFIEIALNPNKGNLTYKNKESFFCESKVCGDKIQGWDCGDAVADWLSGKLNYPGLRLLRQCDFENGVGRSSRKGSESPLSLTNQGQFLLVNVASLRWLTQRISGDGDSTEETPQSEANQKIIDSILLRFRPNLAIEFDEAFVENSLESLRIGDASFQFSGNCTRCQMICIDQQTGEISKEPLQTLSREMQGKIRFGIYLSHLKSAEGKCIEVGAKVKARKRTE